MFKWKRMNFITLYSMYIKLGILRTDVNIY